MAAHLPLTPAVPATLPGIRLDAPLDPSSEEARRWLAEELSGARYRAQPGLLQRLREWLDALLSTGPAAGLPSLALPIAIGLLVAVLALVLVRVLRREVGRSGSGQGPGVLDVPDVPATTLRRQAAAALERGDWDAAVLDAMRAIARGAVERVVLDDAPGRTAHEVAAALATPFPTEAEGLREGADAFDAVRYGHRRADETGARRLVDVDARVAAAHPVRPAPEPVR